MRVLLLLFPVMLSAAELKIDHVTACGADLKAMQAKLRSVGIASDYGGPHSNHATEMALTSFPDGSYLELIAIQPAGEPKAIAAHEWSKQMRANSGPCAWAIRGDKMDAEVERLTSAQVHVSKPEKAGRARPDGVRLEWETAQIGSQVRGTFFPFLIRDLTPRENRAYPSGHPTTGEFTGVAKVVIAVKDLDAAVALYRNAFALAAPKLEKDASFGATLARFEGAPVVLATPLDSKSWLAERIERIGDGLCAIVLKPAKTSKMRWLDERKLGWRLGVE